MIGKVLGGRYQILERIGGGGMAIVYRGLDVLLHRPVSVKTLRPEYVGDSEFVRRFKREAQAAASLSHPSVVNIYDVGQDGETLYIVMEYVDGKTLKQVIEERAPLPVDEAVELTRQICDALAHAHERNIIHRDVKPHNILISRAGRVKVTDFGIARAMSTNTITHNGAAVLGSVHYFSPEQARGGIADAKSDVYSLGVVFYEMLTGKLPFSGETPISVALKHLQEPIVEPRSLTPRIPQSVENIVLRALVKDPRDRYQSVAEMAADLEKALLLPDVPKFMAGSANASASPTIAIPVISDAAAGASFEREDAIVAQEERSTSAVRRILIGLAWVFGILAMIGLAAIAAFYIVFTFFPAPKYTVRNLVGTPYAQARSELIAEGFPAAKIRVSFDQNSSSSVKIGEVESQSPGPGSVSANQDISLVVKARSSQVTMPPLTGYSQSAAEQQLISLGVPSGNISIVPESSGRYPVNQVISTTPTAGAMFNTNTVSVTLMVSSGSQSAAVPDVSGKTLSQAASALQADGFTVGTTAKQPSMTVPSGQVMQQTPAPGQQASGGSAVNLTISTGEPAGAQETIANVDVTIPANVLPPVEVKIVVNDALGQRTAVTASQTSSSATYQVAVTTTPSTPGQVEVYENGQLVKDQVITNGGSGSGSGSGTTPGSSSGSGTGTTPGSSSGSGTGTTSGSSSGSGTGTTPGSSSGSGTGTTSGSSSGSGTGTTPGSSSSSGSSTAPGGSSGASTP